MKKYLMYLSVSLIPWWFQIAEVNCNCEMKTVSSKYQWIYSDDVKRIFLLFAKSARKFLRLLDPKAELQAVFVTKRMLKEDSLEVNPFVLKVKCLLPNFGLSSFSAKNILCQNKKVKSKVVTNFFGLKPSWRSTFSHLKL